MTASSKGLRWHAQVRTLNGHITTYVRIRARNARQADERAQAKAYKDHVKEYPQYTIKDWYTIYLGLHEEDQNSIGKV